MGKLRGGFADILVRKEKITEEQKQQAIEFSQKNDIKLADALLQLGFCDETLIMRAMAVERRMEFVRLEEITIAADVIDKVRESTARENHIVPIAFENGKLKIATSAPEDLGMVDKLRFLLNKEIDLVLATKESITVAINRYYGGSDAGNVDKMMKEFTQTQVEMTDLDGDSAASEGDGDAPIVRLVNVLISEAVQSRASDIHVEPFEDRVRVRYRIDGRLIERDSPPRRLLGAILTRIKIMSGIDITEKRRPQDGRIKTKVGTKSLDLRVSVLPTNHGQSIVMRILDQDNIKISVTDLGFSEDDYRRFQRIIKRPNGIFLVTGPTGSGKTTTLYAALNELNKPDKKIITAEDPVEYYLSGINQCQVASDIGMTFQAIIRAMLRQAPNIILVGEIRDKETADIAIQASLTGHLVFSTLHTNDAPGSITRLVDMGVQPFLVASSLMAAMAQRLVRKVCSQCKEPVSPKPDELRAVGLNPDRLKRSNFMKGVGCKHCGKAGYRGRMGIYELMTVSAGVRELTFKRASHLQVKKQARSEGMKTLFQDGLIKAIKGITTIEEVIDVAGMERE